MIWKAAHTFHFQNRTLVFSPKFNSLCRFDHPLNFPQARTEESALTPLLPRLSLSLKRIPNLAASLHLCALALVPATLISCLDSSSLRMVFPIPLSVPSSPSLHSSQRANQTVWLPCRKPPKDEALLTSPRVTLAFMFLRHFLLIPDSGPTWVLFPLHGTLWPRPLHAWPPLSVHTPLLQ